jgi:outer membrane protein, heavy metal efflux system
LLWIIMASFNLSAQNSYTLKRALQTARVNNLALKSEQLNISIAKTDIIGAKIRLNPKIGNQTIQILNPSLFPLDTKWNNGQNRQVFWQLTKPFQIAGQRKYKIEIANNNVSFEEKNYSETERSLFLEVANKWIEIWATQKQLDIIHKAKTNIDSLVSINQVRLKNQVITPTDLFRTELLEKQYSIQYNSILQNVVNKQKELKFLLGVQDSVSIDTTADFVLTIPANIDSLLNQSLQNRSDIRAAKSLIVVSSSNIKLQKSLAYPQPELGIIYNPQNAIPYLGVSATIELPIFNHNQAEIKKAEINKQQTEQNLMTIKSKIQTELSVAYSSYQIQRLNIQYYKSVLEQSQKILDNVKYAYLKGGTTIIDFLEAQRSWLDTQQQYNDVLQQYHQDYIQLLYTTGLINQLAQ